MDYYQQAKEITAQVRPYPYHVKYATKVIEEALVAAYNQGIEDAIQAVKHTGRQTSTNTPVEA